MLNRCEAYPWADYRAVLRCFHKCVACGVVAILIAAWMHYLSHTWYPTSNVPEMQALYQTLYEFETKGSYVLALFCGLLGGWQYRWLKKNPPPLKFTPSDVAKPIEER